MINIPQQLLTLTLNIDKNHNFSLNLLLYKDKYRQNSKKKDRCLTSKTPELAGHIQCEKHFTNVFSREIGESKNVNQCMKILAPEDAECLPLLVPAAGPGAAELGGGPEDLQVHEGRLLHPQDLFQLNKFFLQLFYVI